MNDLLAASRRHERLKKLKRIRRILVSIPLLVLCMFLVDWGITFSHASSSQIEDGSSIRSIVYPKDSAKIKEELAPKIVHIKTAEGTTSHLVYANKPTDIIKEVGMELSYYDIILPEDMDEVINNSVLQIVRVNVGITTKTESIPFATIQVPSDSLVYGQVEVGREGVLGVAEKTIRVIYEDGKAKKSEVVDSKVISAPVEKIIHIGKKAVGIRSCDHWGQVIDQVVSDSKQRKWMKFVMYHETGCFSGSISYTNKYFGLFQFLPSTFNKYADPGSDIFDGEAQIKAVDRMYRLTGGASSYLGKQWPNAHKDFLSKNPDWYK